MTATAERPTATTVADAAPGWLVWTALWTVYILWGSTYLAIRWVVDTMPPFLSAGLRFVTAALIVLAVVAVRDGRAAFAVTRPQVATASLVGVALLLGGNGLISYAEKSVPSGLAALIVAVVPLWVILLRLGAGDRPRRTTVLGVLLGFAGVALLVSPSGDLAGGGLNTALVVIASFCWAAGSYYGTRRPQPTNAGVAIGLQMLVGGAALLVVGGLRGEAADVRLSEFSTSSMLALAYLVVFGSLVAFTAYAWLLRVAPVSKVSTYAYVNPVVAVALGAALADEVITGTMLVAGAIIVVAVAIVVREESRRRPSPSR